MVEGLDRFKKHFASHTNQYVLIGGVACTIVLEKLGLSFRATKDLDVVLTIEVLDKGFSKVFHQFINMGEYQVQESSSVKQHFYRFKSPKDSSFPAMLELFSRKPDAIELKKGRLTPIPIDDKLESLSALLLDDDSYRLIHEGKRVIDGLSVASPIALVVLKAHACVNFLAADKQSDARKHKNDVIRLYQLLSSNDRIYLDPSKKAMMEKFIESLIKDPPDFKNLRVKRSLEEVIKNLRQLFNL